MRVTFNIDGEEVGARDLPALQALTKRAARNLADSLVPKHGIGRATAFKAAFEDTVADLMFVAFMLNSLLIHSGLSEDPTLQPSDLEFIASYANQAAGLQPVMAPEPQIVVPDAAPAQEAAANE